MKNPWTTLSNDEVYNNPWIQVSHRKVITPNGTDGIYGLVHFKNEAIGIIPIDDEGYTWLVGQYRYTIEEYSWEIPEGGCPIGTEAPLDTAKRELLEETGLRAAHWEHILDFHTSNSVTDEVGKIYIARGLTQGEAEPEHTEDLKVKRLPLSEALEMVFRGEITDLMSVAGLMRAQLIVKG
ncbi:MAG: NUDIX hydrolase [Mameliella sp.]|nr:NUDIX hydrolase [Phaeodactylibacter sp.]